MLVKDLHDNKLTMSISSKRKKKCRCCVCKKKIPSILVEMHTCRCGKLVCGQHKSESLHDCTFDWKSHGKDILSSTLSSAKSTTLLDKI